MCVHNFSGCFHINLSLWSSFGSHGEGLPAAAGPGNVGIVEDKLRGELALLVAVLRIHDILVWIRIRGSMPLTNGS